MMEGWWQMMYCARLGDDEDGGNDGDDVLYDGGGSFFCSFKMSILQQFVHNFLCEISFFCDRIFGDSIFVTEIPFLVIPSEILYFSCVKFAKYLFYSSLFTFSI